MNKKISLLLISSLIQLVSHADDFDPFDPEGKKVIEDRRGGLIKSRSNSKDPEPSTINNQTIYSQNQIENRYKQQIADSQNFVSQARLELKKNKESLQAYKSEEFDKASKEASQSWWSSFGSKVGGVFGTEPDQNVLNKAKIDQANLEKKKDNYNGMVKIFEEKEQDLSKRESELIKSLNQRKNDQETLSKSIGLFQAHLERSDAFRDLKDLKLDFLEAQDKLNMIENQLDRSAVGNYVQTKMGKFMNSESFCQAAYQCNGKNGPLGPLKKANVSQQNFRKEIFEDRTLAPNSESIETAK